MDNKVFTITGNKISSLCFGNNSLMFSSQTFKTVEDFMESWHKKLSLATKVEIKFESIKSVKKEDTDEDILISYKWFWGIPTNCEFAFSDANDNEAFFYFLEKEKSFSKTHEKMTAFKAILNYLIGLIFTIAITIFSYFQALEIANGTVAEAVRGKIKVFNEIIEFLGDKGVLAIGGVLACYLLYKIWTRFSNPPYQLKFFPPTS